MCVFSGNAQVRTIDHERTEPTRKATGPIVIKDTLRISESQLIERKSDPGSYAKFMEKARVGAADWQPMVIGIPERGAVTEKKEEAESVKEVRSTPYHLLPLLKEKGHIQGATNSRWQLPVKKGGSDEK